MNQNPASSKSKMAMSIGYLLLIIFLLSISGLTSAQQKVIQLYKGNVPGSENWTWDEKETNKNFLNTRIAYNVAHPTLTVFTPDPLLANGTSVIICPGGGFHILLIDYEGSEVASRLNRRGVTVFLLKYRLVHSLTDDPWKEMQADMDDSIKFEEKTSPVAKMALEDAQNSIIYVRKHAAEFGLDSNRIGLMGFSAGGDLVASLAYHFTDQTRPDFAAPIYAYVPSTEKTVPHNAPPLFIAAATDDQFGLAPSSVKLYSDWLDSKHSAELHLYSTGGHGLRGFPANSWIDRFMEWLDLQSLLKPKK